MASSPLRVGLVGFGFAGQAFHAPVLSAVPGLALVAVASSQAQKVHAAWPGVAVVSDADALLARADGPTPCSSTPQRCATARRSKTTFMRCCATTAAPMPRYYYAAVRDAIHGTGPNPVPPSQAVALMELLDLGRQSDQELRALPT